MKYIIINGINIIDATNSTTILCKMSFMMFIAAACSYGTLNDAGQHSHTHED